MVFLALTPEVKSTPEEVAEKLKREGILAGVTGPRTFRLVLHYWIDDPGVEKTIAAFQQALQ
jgi:acetylornithine/succinyldiaminopimelate/putrescine aminotransferase